MCKCVDTLNSLLAKDNTKVEEIWSIGRRRMIPIIGIRSAKVDITKRGKPKTIAATFCPFCGKLLTQGKDTNQ